MIQLIVCVINARSCKLGITQYQSATALSELHVCKLIVYLHDAILLLCVYLAEDGQELAKIQKVRVLRNDVRQGN